LDAQYNYWLPIGKYSNRNGPYFMRNNNYPFGERFDWRYDPSSRLRQEDGDSERAASEDSIVAELAKRTFVKSCKSKDGKFKACELLAMLPECPRTSKSVDEIVLEGLNIIELWNS
jgi:hypothetical protein